jgi:NADH-quinone oxidoreductase subunit N
LIAWNQVSGEHAAEMHACLLSCVVGANFVALSNDLVEMFLALELVSIATYILLCIPGRSRETLESTLKYFLLSIFSSALFLYGVSWLFGVAGTTSIPGIVEAMSAENAVANPTVLKMGMALVIMGIAFRLTAVPFHFYAPDVFQGATSSVAAMLSFIPKLVGIVALLRLLPAFAGQIELADWAPSGSIQQLLAFLAVVTMFGGNLLALGQRNVYRLLACSSIAHAGYMLVGLTIGNADPGVGGTTAVLFYLAAYGLMTVGLFALLTAARGAESPIRLVSDLSGLSQVKPVESLLMALCLFSMTGLPPTGGFLGKFGLFVTAWSDGTWMGRILAISLAVNTVIAAWYYLRLVGLMYFGSPKESESHSRQPLPLIAGVTCAIGTLLLFVMPQQIWTAIFNSAL